jgi:hypothetical protein
VNAAKTRARGCAPDSIRTSMLFPFHSRDRVAPSLGPALTMGAADGRVNPYRKPYR